MARNDTTVQDVLRFFPSPTDGPANLKTLWITNMWPDEVRPYFGNYIKTQCESLWSAGLDVDVLYIRGLLNKVNYFKALPEVRRRVRDKRYRVIHAHYGHTGAVAVATGSTPLIISFCGEDLLRAPRGDSYTMKSTIEAACFRHLPWRTAATITKSKEMELRLPERLRRRNHVLPNGVDTSMFQPRSKADARRQLGWEADGEVVLFLGDPGDPRKRVELAREAIVEVQRAVPTARLEVAFGYEPSLIPQIMNASDVLVFTSRSEGSPNAIKEAMASALPIVSTPVGDVVERLSGVTGCYVREPTPEAFAPALVDAIRGGRSDPARERVGEISMTRIAERLRDIYERASRGAS